jgi:hypothetical protein
MCWSETGMSEGGTPIYTRTLWNGEYGRNRSHSSIKECSSSSELEEKQRKSKIKNNLIVSLKSKENISYYLPFGKNCLPYATSFCTEHCLLKEFPFKSKMQKRIQEISLQKIEVDDLINNMEKSKSTYFTLFASGCIENTNISIKSLIYKFNKKFPSKYLRIFLRSFQEIDKSTEKIKLITSIDHTTPIQEITKIISGNTSIAIIDHPKNKDLILYLLLSIQFNTSKLKKSINCSECHGHNLCFKEPNNFLLIQELKQNKSK